MPKGTTLTSYDPSLRDRIGYFVYDMAEKMGLGNQANRMREDVQFAADFLPGVGEGLGVDETVRAARAGNYGEAAVNAAGTVAGVVPGGEALGMFLGPLSKRWDAAKHFQAMDMAERGATRSDVWSTTNMHRGPDRRWRTEIDDSEARLSPKILDPGSYRLQDILEHPELYENYPDLANMTVRSEVSEHGNFGTYYPPQFDGTERLQVDPNAILDRPSELPGPEENIKSTLLHEIQHAIQNREGFDPGFNPELAGQQIWRDNSFPQATLQRIYNDYTKQFGDAPSFNEWGNKVAYETYLRNAGESEARNVQTRMMMDPTTRKMVPPWQSADRTMREQLTANDILYGIFSPKGVPGLSLRGPVRRIR